MIRIVGDIHGLPAVLEAIVRQAEEDDRIAAIFQLGDLGIFPDRAHLFADIKPRKPFYWERGNHEFDPYYDALTEVTEFFPNMFFVPNGNVIDLDGRRIGVFGGAASVDRKWRRSGINWWPDEVPSRAEFERLWNAEGPFDLMFTHTPPTSTILTKFGTEGLLHFDLPRTWRCPVAQMVEDLWNKHGCPSLCAGHMHPIGLLIDRNVHVLPIAGTLDI